MPTLDYVPSEQITPESQEILDKIKRQEGFVSKIYLVLAQKPTLLRAFWELRQAVMEDGIIDKKTKEMLAFAVAIANKCEYCIWAHTEELKKMGVGQEERLEIISVVSLLNSFNALFDGIQLKFT